MPKTRNAHALRGYDAKRILQRPYFRQFRFVAEPDAEILQSLRAADEDSVDVLEMKLNTVKATHERLGEFRKLVRKHYCGRCDKYNRRKAEAEGVKVNELRRPAGTIEYFTAELDCIELMDKFGKLYYELEKIIETRYRKEFAARLKSARKAAGLTQKELGDKVQVSPQGFSLYERAERDVPIHTIIRLSKVLHLSGNDILGFS